MDIKFWVLIKLFESPVPSACKGKNGLNICRIAHQGITRLKVRKNLGPNRSAISDLRQCLNFEAKKGPETAEI